MVFYYRNVSWFNNGFCRVRWKGAFAVLILLAAALAGTGCDRGDHPAQVGTIAPDFTVHDQGQAVSLDQYRGKTVVLNFWASWCPPCLEEFPSLMQLQKQVPNVVVLAVSFDTDADAYRQYVADNHLGDMVVALDLAEVESGIRNDATAGDLHHRPEGADPAEVYRRAGLDKPGD